MRAKGLALLAGGFVLWSTGCTNIEGVWMIEVAIPPVLEDCDTEATDWNFNSASPPVDVADPNWSTDEKMNLSNMLIFAQIVKRGKNAVLLWNDLAFPSIEGSKGKAWTFEWTGSTQDVYSADHALGYTCSMETTDSSTITMALAFAGKDVTGTIDAKDDHVGKYEESDRWTQEANGPKQCGMPAAQYLEVLVSGGGGGGVTYQPASNSQQDVDCASDPCTLKVEHHCSTSYDVTGVHTGYNKQNTYDNVDDAGQLFGDNPLF